MTRRIARAALLLLGCGAVLFGVIGADVTGMQWAYVTSLQPAAGTPSDSLVAGAVHLYSKDGSLTFDFTTFADGTSPDSINISAGLAAGTIDSSDIAAGGISLTDINQSNASDGEQLEWSTSDGQWIPGPDGGSGSTEGLSYSLTLEDPVATDEMTISFTNRAITVTEIRTVLLGSSTPSVTWTVRHGTDRSATGAEVVTSGTTTTSVSTGSDVTSFNDETIIVDSFVWAEITAQSGTVDEIHITIVYTED